MIQTATYKETPTFFKVDYAKKSVSKKGRINYSTFGSIMTGRSYNPDVYRYGHSEMEKDNEISGNGNAYDFQGYGYDPRLGKRKNLDPKNNFTPWESPYSYVGNNPNLYIDRDGKTKVVYLTVISQGVSTTIKIVDKNYTKPVSVVVPVRTGMGIMNKIEVRQYDVLETRTINLDDPSKSKAPKETLLGVTDEPIETALRAVGDFLGGDFTAGGGIAFYSKDGQGQETRIAKGDFDGYTNIDDLLGAMSVSSAAATMKGVALGGKTALERATNFLGNVKRAIFDANEVGGKVGDAYGTSPTTNNPQGDTVCTFCNTSGNHGFGFTTGGKTFDDKGGEVVKPK